MAAPVSGGFFKGRVVRVTVMIAAVKGRLVGLRQRRAAFEALRQIRIGNERAAKRDAIGPALFYPDVCGFCVEVAVGDISAGPVGTQAVEDCALLRSRLAAREFLDDVQVSET